MPLSWNEIRNRAHEFSKRWKNETSEDAKAKAQRLPPHGKPDNLVADSLGGNGAICDENSRSWAAKKLFDEKLKIQFMKLRSCPFDKSKLLLKLTGSRTGR